MRQMREAALRPGNEARSPADAQFDELQAYVVGLEEKLQQCLKTAQMLVRRQRELANTTFEYGLAMTLLGQSESGLLGASYLSHLSAMSRASAFTYPSRLYHAGMTTLRT